MARSITWFRQDVRRQRPEHRRIDPADRQDWQPGDAAPCDLWFPLKKIPLEDGTARLLPVLVVTAARLLRAGYHGDLFGWVVGSFLRCQAEACLGAYPAG